MRKTALLMIASVAASVIFAGCNPTILRRNSEKLSGYIPEGVMPLRSTKVPSCDEEYYPWYTYTSIEPRMSVMVAVEDGFVNAFFYNAPGIMYGFERWSHLIEARNIYDPHKILVYMRRAECGEYEIVYASLDVSEMTASEKTRLSKPGH